MRFKVIEEFRDDSSTSALTVDDYLDSIRNNRERLRSTAAMLQSICGLLISASFLILFFLIQGQLTRRELGIYVLMFAEIIALLISLFASLMAVYVRPPTAVSSKGEQLEQQLKLCRKERQWVSASLVLLSLAIVIFLICMAVFAIRIA